MGDSLTNYLRAWFKCSWSKLDINERISLRGRLQKEHTNCVNRKWNNQNK